MIGFAAILQADINSTEGPSSKKMLPPGQFQSMIKGFKQHVGKPDVTTGIASTGVYIEYTVVEGEESSNEFREYINLTTKKGEPNPYGPSTLKRRLLSAGFTVEQLAKFREPKNEKDMGDFAKLIGKIVNVTVDHEIQKSGDAKYNGRPRLRIVRVEALPTQD